MSFLWITMINHGYIDFCKNFLLSMKKSKVLFKLIIFLNKDYLKKLIMYIFKLISYKNRNIF